MSKSPAAIIYDATGTNPVALVLDGSFYRLRTEAKLAAGHGLALDATLLSVKADTARLNVDLSTRASAAAQTDGSQKSQVVNGANTLAIDGSGRAAIQNAPNLDVALSTRLAEATFIARVGEVQAMPTANTLLGRLKDIVDSLAARFNTLGQKTMANSAPIVIASDQSALNTVLRDAAGNELATLKDAALLSTKPGIVAMGADAGNVARRLLVTGDGRLITSTAVAAPSGTTPVSQGVVGDVNGGVPPAYANSFYTIPNGATLRIQRFSGGAEVDTAGSKVSLFYAPNGNETGLELIRAGYASGNNFEFTLDYTAPAAGNGTRAIMIRRERLAGGTIEIAGFWDGYY